MDVSSHLNPPIQIVLAIWDLADVYNRYAAVTIVSLLENTSSSIEFHLLYDELKNNARPAWSENRQKYHEIEKKYGTKIIFHHVSVPEWCSALPALRFFTLGALLRLFIPEILSDLDRVIYLDCDIVVRGDIQSLWDENLGTSCIGARSHVGKSDFNSGVLLLDLHMMRQNYDLTRSSLQFLSDHLTTPCPDQDALNFVFGDSYHQLDRKYNLYSEEHSSLSESDIIIHFTWIKPWKIHTDIPANYEFWKYFMTTPWCDDVSILVKELVAVSDLSPAAQSLYVDHLIILPFGKRLQYFIRSGLFFVRLNWRELRAQLGNYIFKFIPWN